MYELEYSTQFKKDFKRITKMPIPDIVEVGHVIATLQNGGTCSTAIPSLPFTRDSNRPLSIALRMWHAKIGAKFKHEIR